jgi:hypothetical protein
MLKHGHLGYKSRSYAVDLKFFKGTEGETRRDRIQRRCGLKLLKES